jgi:hypothetical protein
LHERAAALNFPAMKLVVAVLLAANSFYLEGCAEIPDTDDVHDQQMQHSFAAPGQPVKPTEIPDTSSRQTVPGE